jgi:hypothetical protein
MAQTKQEPSNYKMILTCIPGVRRMFTRSVDLTRVFLGNDFSSFVSPESAISRKENLWIDSSLDEKLETAQFNINYGVLDCRSSL